MDNNTISSGNVKLPEDYSTLQIACIKSFLDECKNLKQEFDKLSQRYERVEALIEQYNQGIKWAKEKEAEVLARSKALLDDPKWEENQEEITAIKQMAEAVGQHKKDLETGKYLSNASKVAYSYIVDCVAFAARIQRRKTFWQQFGLANLGNIEDHWLSAEEAADAQKKFYGTAFLQQAVILDAQGIFLLAKPYFAKAQSIQEELLKAVKVFKVKNILN